MIKNLSFRSHCSTLVVMFSLLLTCTLFIPLFARDTKLVVSLGYVPHVQFAPFYLAQEYGYFKQKKLSVVLQYGMSKDSLVMLSQHKTDIALVDSDQFIFARSKKIPVKAFYQYYEKLPICIFTTHLPLMQNLKNLEGKKIGVPELFGTSFFGLNLFLHHYKLKDKVKIVRIGYEQIPLLIEKKIDMAVGYRNNEPLFLEHDKRKYKSWNISDFEPLITGPVLVAHEKSFQNPKILEDFGWALKKATQDLKNDPDTAFKVIAPLLGLRPHQHELAKKILLSSSNLMGNNVVPNPKSYKYTMDKLVTLGILQNSFPIEEDGFENLL